MSIIRKKTEHLSTDNTVIVKKSFTRIIISLVITILIFCVLIAFQNYLLQDKQVTDVVICQVAQIPAGTELTSQNIGNYFTTIKMNKNYLSKNSGVYKNIQDIPEGITTGVLSMNEIVYQKDITNKKELTKYINENDKKVELAISIEGMTNSVGGLIRNGDVVNIYSVQASNTTNSDSSDGIHKRLLYGDIYVEKALTSSGAEIYREGTLEAEGNSDTITSVIIVDVTEEMALDILNAIADGSISVGKVK